jgi:hypothetical protein
VDVPAGVPVVDGELGGELLLLEGVIAMLPHPREAMSTSTIKAKLGLNRRPVPPLNPNKPMTSIAKTGIRNICLELKGTVGSNPLDRVVVVTLTVSGVGAFPFRDTDAGETTQLAAAGAPLQVMLTSPLNAVGVRFTLNVADSPALTVAEV